MYKEPIHAIIVDDEAFACSSLYFLIQQQCPNILVKGIANSVAQAKELLKNHSVELIFLDIAMPGANGFELIGDAQRHGCSVIFTTAYDQYALKAIKANALDYLLKPIDIDELIAAVEKAALHLHQKGQRAKLLDERIQNLESQILHRTEIKKITLPHGQGFKVIELEDIMHIEADSNYSVFYLRTKEKIAVSKVLKEFEEILPEAQFVRVHKSNIVNLKYVQEYNSKNGISVRLIDDVEIPVSRRRASDFLERIKNFTQQSFEK